MNKKERKTGTGKAGTETAVPVPEEISVEQGTVRTGENAPLNTATAEASGGPKAALTQAPDSPKAVPAEVSDGTKTAKTEASGVQRGSTSVFLYISLLFSAALLLMGLSSLIHQRNNTEALGKLQSSVSVMREAQNLQGRIIALQDAQRELEERLKNAQNDWSNAVAQAEAERKRVDALERLYVMDAQYQAGDYAACQGNIDEFEAKGLAEILSSESPASGVVSPLERYRQIREAVPVRIAEASQPPEATGTP